MNVDSGDAWADASSIWVAPVFNDLEAAILSTVAYADVFDYPLTAVQIHRYLVGTVASPAEIVAALTGSSDVRCALNKKDELYALRGRESIIDLRQRRAAVAARLWPRALRYGRAIAALPFVRMVALTGALTMDNVESDDDFDYLIITEPGRLWLARALIIGLVVKSAARRGDEICPNYLLSERALVFDEHNLYTAHELAQMIPLSGESLYQKMRLANPWTAHFLPNAQGPPRDVNGPEAGWRPVRALAEVTLRTPVGARLERWERKRKIRKFTDQIEDEATVSFSADQCKGHFESHAQPVLTAFARRLRRVRDLTC